MRQTIIDRIRNSSKWRTCVDNGMGDELPNLNVLPDDDLLTVYHFYYCGIS